MIAKLMCTIENGLSLVQTAPGKDADYWLVTSTGITIPVERDHDKDGHFAFYITKTGALRRFYRLDGQHWDDAPDFEI